MSQIVQVPLSLRKRKARWPVVLGVIAIVYSVPAVLVAFALGGLICMANPIFGVVGIATMVFGLLCPVGGYFLIKRKPAGQKALLIWSWGQIGVSCLSLFLVIVLLLDRDQHAMTSAGGVEGVAALSCILYAVFPVFLVILLTRGFVRRDLNGW